MLAKLFTKDPMNLRGPNVQKAPETSFSLSGSTLRFKCPPQTASIPGIFKGSNFDFERDTDEEIGDPHNRHEIMLKTGWDFEDGWWKGMTFGGIRVGVFIAHNVWRLAAKDSLFRKTNLVRHSLDQERDAYIRCSASSAQVDRSDISEEDIRTKRYWSQHIPETKDDIELVSINGINWACFETYFPDSPPRVHFEAAVEHNNMVRFVFSQDAFGGIDFFGPDHNLKEACHNLIQEIMGTVTLDLSPKAQQQREDVIARYGKDEVI
ncbi:hypothetical protein [Marinimicrobium locisalis]|uniref:hypothetical protein n=1 Tax=Marinimicrobium locisalis TaxID=546022 RepID=UPI003221BF1F